MWRRALRAQPCVAGPVDLALTFVNPAQSRPEIPAGASLSEEMAGRSSTRSILPTIKRYEASATNAFSATKARAPANEPSLALTM
jgi:hypothetical protein